MPDQNCACERPEAFTFPVSGLSFNVNRDDMPEIGLSREEVARMIEEAMHSQPGEPGTTRRWQSDWFDIAASSVHTFEHNLELEAPWESNPRIVIRVDTAAAGWEAGDIVFGDGANHVITNGSGVEIGWAVAVSASSAHVTFGNDTNIMRNAKTGGRGSLPKANVKGKLVLDY